MLQTSPSRRSPVPARDALTVPPGVAFTVKVALFSPALEGVNETTTLQVAPAANVPVHVVEAATMANCAASVPPIVVRPAVVVPAGFPPVLVTVKVSVLTLVCPITVPSNDGGVTGEIDNAAVVVQTPPAALQIRPP